MNSILHAFETFWQRHPALLYALAILVGIAAALAWNSAYLVTMALLFLPCLLSPLRWRVLLAGLLLLGAYFYARTTYQFPELGAEGETGKAHIEIASLSSRTSAFGKQWIYRGSIRRFENDQGVLLARNIPFTLSLSQKESIKRPLADHAYVVEGKIKEIIPGYYSLNVLKDSPWRPVEGSWSLAEWRYHIKQAVTNYIRDHISGEREATFLAGIATGDFDDRTMFYEFGRFGLQHIMAISGFHFAIIAAILSGLLRLIVSRKIATLFLIFLLSSYFVFLGSGSSIMRAWITILIVLFGYLIAKRGSGLNSLGIAMMAILFMDPLLCRSIGFQFSFITTAAILMFFSSSDLLMQKVFRKRSLSQMVVMDGVNQHGYCVLSFCRQALAMTIAVNLIALPMTFFHFQKFPLMSLIYNLFFPFLVSIAMLLLILGMLFSWVPILGSVIHTANAYYSHFMLNFIYNMPASLDLIWRVQSISSEFLIVYLSVAFSGGIYLNYALEKYQEEQKDLVFI